MKQILSITIISFCLFTTIIACAQNDKSKRPSPPATAKETISSGATILIDYSQPSVKGRVIGKDIEPSEGKVWRTGANEATIFETDKDLTIEGKSLPAGKYSFFTIKNGDEWTIIFNKIWKQWGAFGYKESEDALRVNVKSVKAEPFSEKLVFTIAKEGAVTFTWGEYKVSFNVK